MHYQHCWVSASSGFQSAALVALIIGIPTLLIAFNQYRLGAAKLKLDLFDKRFAIFQKTWVIFSETVQSGTKARSHGLFSPFNNFLPEAAFLFGKDIEQYLSDASKKWTGLRAVESELDGLGVNRPEHIEKRRELTNWFEEQASSGVRAKFGSYLNFENWK